MKAQGNWKAWEKGDNRRIYVSDCAYFERGENGLMSQVGLQASEIDFAARIFADSANGADFDKWFNSVKLNKTKRTAKKEKVSPAQFKALFEKHVLEGMISREAANLAQQGL